MFFSSYSGSGPWILREEDPWVPCAAGQGRLCYPDNANEISAGVSSFHPSFEGILNSSRRFP